MSENKYTPGPWIIDPAEVAEKQDPGFFGYPGDPEGYHMISTDAWRLTGHIGDANAKLIAAAPELLEALKRLLGSTNTGNADEHDEGCRCVIHEARAAIAKASA